MTSPYTDAKSKTGCQETPNISCSPNHNPDASHWTLTQKHLVRFSLP